MSLYLDAKKTINKSPNMWKGRRVKISGITIHWWGKPEKTGLFDSTVRYLCTPRGKNSTSAHFVLESGRIACLVHPENTAWHAGKGNSSTIGIEVNPRGTNGEYETLIGLIVNLWLNYGKIPLYPHKYWKNTECPGVYSQAANWNRIQNGADQLYQSIITDTERPPRRRIQYSQRWWGAA